MCLSAVSTHLFISLFFHVSCCNIRGENTNILYILFKELKKMQLIYRDNFAKKHNQFVFK